MVAATANRAGWCGAPIELRLEAFDSMWIEAADHVRVRDLIVRKDEYVRLTRKCEGVMVICESGGGKTTLCRELERKFPDEVLEEKTLRRFVLMGIPKVCSRAQLAKALLNALNCPAWDSGNAEDNLKRAIELIRNCGVRVLAVDNFQDIPERRTRGGVRVVGNWFRDLIDKIGVVFVALGTKEARRVRLANDQVRRRIMTTVAIPYFSLKTKETMTVWLRLLTDIDSALPMGESSALAEADLAGKLFIACNGVWDYLAMLLKRAMTVAVQRGSERIEIADLCEAYPFIMGEVAKHGNPFEPGFRHRLLNRFNEPFYKMGMIVGEEDDDDDDQERAKGKTKATERGMAA